MNKNHVPFSDKEQQIIQKVVDERGRVERRFPLVIGLLVTFGFVSTLYGFEKIIDRLPLLANNPWLLIATGLLTLFATGTVYQKLN